MLNNLKTRSFCLYSKTQKLHFLCCLLSKGKKNYFLKIVFILLTLLFVCKKPLKKIFFIFKKVYYNFSYKTLALIFLSKFLLINLAFFVLIYYSFVLFLLKY